jgi:hypothetical protein
MSLFSSASYHHISPLTRTRSRSLSSTYGPSALRRYISWARLNAFLGPALIPLLALEDLLDLRMVMEAVLWPDL